MVSFPRRSVIERYTYSSEILAPIEKLEEAIAGHA
jgi:hypothetical protein